MASMRGMSMSPDHKDPPAFHDMLLVGATTAYLYHLPMFMSPHDYQVVLEVALTKAGGDPFAAYVDDRKATGTEMYSFAPSVRFVLTDLISPDPTHPGVSQIPGTIFRGHFEGGHFEAQGEPLIDKVVAQIVHVVQFRKFAPNAPDLPQLAYLAFGKGGEIFVAHVLSKAPDFDQVLGATIGGQQLADDQLGQGVLVTVAGRPNDASHKLSAGEQFPAQAQVTDAHGQAVADVTVRIGAQFYFETRDLAR
jgi:hypothetical protein